MADSAEDDFSHLNKVSIFRRFAEEATRNSHVTIKQCWTILFTGGTFALLHSFDELVECTFSAHNLSHSLEHLGTAERYCIQLHQDWSLSLLSLVLFAVYGLTFYRFYVGNIRVFDIKYDEAFKFINLIHDEKNWREGIRPSLDYKEKERTRIESMLKYSDSLTKSEVFQLMLTTLIIVYLTVTPLNPPKFLLIYFLLLVADIYWMFKRTQDSQHFFSKQFFKVFQKELPDGDENEIGRIFPKYATNEWHKNNWKCGAALFITLLLYGSITIGHYGYLDWTVYIPLALSQRELILKLLLWIGAGIAFYNCYRDLHATWAFYNPKFAQAYDKVVQKNSSKS